MDIIYVFIEQAIDGGYFAYMNDVQDIQGIDYSCNGCGETIDDCIKDYYDCYDEIKRVYKEKGWDFVEAEFTFMIHFPKPESFN